MYDNIAVFSDEYVEYRKVLVDTIASQISPKGYGTLCVCGRELNPRREFHQDFSLGNEIYPLLRENQVNGIICLSGGLGHNVNLQTLSMFLSEFSIPMVSLGIVVPGTSSVFISDELGMTDLMVHLISQKGVQRFAYLRGFQNDPYSSKREQIFRRELAKCNIPVDERYFINGDYDPYESYRKSLELLELHGENIDVIVAANDCMALSAARAASALGFEVGVDILISGFDDTSEASRFSPGLTTVRQPLEKMAESGVELLLEQINVNEQSRVSCNSTARNIVVNSELIVRGSTQYTNDKGSSEAAFRPEEFHHEIERSLVGLSQPDTVDLEAITQSVFQAITDRTDELFDFTRNKILDQIQRGKQHWWLNLCSQLENHLTTRIQLVSHQKNLVKVLTALGLIKERAWAMLVEQEFQQRRHQSAHESMQLQMSSSTRIEHVLATTENWLSLIKAKRFFLITFPQPAKHPPDQAQLVYAHKLGQPKESSQYDFATKAILPGRFADEFRDGLLLMYPIFAGEWYFGYLLLDPDGLELAEMSTVASSIGNALRNRYMINRLKSQTESLSQVNQELEQLATIDTLTKLPNRHDFHKKLDLAFTRSLISKTKMGVMFVDLDGFKKINDTCGHKGGDEVLVIVADVLKAELNNTKNFQGQVARLGGDEFTIILEDVADPLMIIAFANSILAKLTTLTTKLALPSQMSASIGYSMASQGADSTSVLLHQADSAMYRAKQNGKNQVIAYDPSLEKAIKEKQLLEQRICEAIENRTLSVYFQPRVDALTGEILSAEALTRWEKLHGSEIITIAYPDQFIPIAESSGMIQELDLLALSQCCKQINNWSYMGIDLPLSVNISVLHLQKSDFVNRVLDVIASHRVPNESIELEITEGAMMTDVEQCIDKLQSLKDTGIRISIDDFGTGYSSLSYLKKLPITNLKIDRSFLSGVTGSSSCTNADATIVRTIVTLGKTMEVALVAEGVETEEQLEFVRSLGVDEVQGYFYYRPLAESAMTKVLMEQRDRKRAA